MEPPVDGLLLVDKPEGPTSHDVVGRIRRVLGQKRVGHAGTLDPMASGLLPLMLGRATRLLRYLPHSPKHYRGTIQLGRSTDTDDANLAGYGSALVGHTWIVGPHLVLALGGGVQRIDYGVGDYGLHTFFPAAHTNIGVAW